MSIPLATPFYVVLAKEYTGDSISNLGLLVVLSGIANVVSSPLWGKFADRSSRKMMAVVALIGIATGIYSLLYPLFNFDNYEIYLFAPVILFNNVAHAGARLSRKTYLVDMAPEDERPTYVSLSNTLIGLFTILAATFGVISSLISNQAQIGFFMVMMIASIGFAFSLKEV
ncbi:MFS transporter [Mangrovivirga cuniculi]|uniref:MFS transporter n=1 Tax=Mangrovivirga cuniculi TaxID=2715131 RepID=UPI001C2F6315|nr:MFS transporter [Mangrovivirga cuniculi]